MYEGGLQQPNPYTTDNMKMALNNIKAKIKTGEYRVVSTQTFKSNSNESSNSTSILAQFSVNTSHLYVKFIPQSEAELALLKRDSTLILSEYPLDFEFDDLFYENRPELPSGTFPEYFTSVAVNQSLPNVSMIHIADLYIPEEDDFFYPDADQPITDKGVIGNEEDLFHHLLFEAYALVGKEDDLTSDHGEIIIPGTTQAKWIFGRKWQPKGTLKHWDGKAGFSSGGQHCTYGFIGLDYSGCYDNDGTFSDCPEYVYGWSCVDLPDVQGSFVPLEGAQVLMRQWFTVRQGISNHNGYFQTKTVRGKARYILQWERYEYSIRNGSFFQAETRGPKVKDQPWNPHIQGGDDEYHAMIHAEAHEYYYGDRMGTITPPKNSPGNYQMKIAARELNDQSSHIPFFTYATGGLVAQIMIKAWGDTSDEIYGTTIHELAHAAHKNITPFSYDDVVADAYTNVCFTPPIGNCHDPLGPTANNNRRLLETWATTIETLFTRRRYVEKYGMTNYSYTLNNFQQREILQNNHYTSAGIDMVEGNYGLPIINQSLVNSARPIDNVNNYTLEELEYALIFAQSWWQWRDNIYNYYPNNPSRVHLNQLFNNW